MYKIGDIITTNEGDNVVAEITNITLDYWGDESNIIGYRIRYLNGTEPHDPTLHGYTNCISDMFINGLYFGLIKGNLELKHTMT